MKKYSFIVSALMIVVVLLSAAVPAFAAPDVVTLGFFARSPARVQRKAQQPAMHS